MSANRPEGSMFSDPLFRGSHSESTSSRIKQITEGSWGTTPWYFEVGTSHPPEELCTAAFGVVVYQGRIGLVEHVRRGFELPGGHKDPTESSQQAVKREIREEAGAVVHKPAYFGHKRVVAKDVPHRDKPGEFYPPESFVPYYFAEADEVLNVQPSEDIKSIVWVTWDEAQKLLAPGHNHDVIIRYLLTEGFITLS